VREGWYNPLQGPFASFAASREALSPRAEISREAAKPRRETGDL